MPLGVKEVRGILPRGGTILGSSRTNPFKIDGGVEKIKANLAELGVDALVAIGGEDTLGVATKLDELGVNVVGVPKTIDNDLGATDFTFGFDTAVNIAMEAIDRLHTTAESPPPHAGGRGDGPARRLDRAARRAGRRRQRDPAAGAQLRRRPGRRATWRSGSSTSTRRSSWSPRAPSRSTARWSLHNQELDAFGHVRLGGIGQWLAEQLEAKTGKEARTVVLGHIQRGGTPTAFDRVLATRFGLQAIDAVHEGDWGKMVALRGTDIVRVPLDRGRPAS